MSSLNRGLYSKALLPVGRYVNIHSGLSRTSWGLKVKQNHNQQIVLSIHMCEHTSVHEGHMQTQIIPRASDSLFWWNNAFWAPSWVWHSSLNSEAFKKFLPTHFSTEFWQLTHQKWTLSANDCQVDRSESRLMILDNNC